MSSVIPISARQDLERFLGYFYGDEEGYVYSPVKHSEKDESWEQHFFYWPKDREKLIKHVQYMSANFDVYISPGLFTSPSGKESDFKGSHFVWAEFDGNSTEASIKLPQGLSPSIRVQSSVPGHEHWYWHLEGFVTDFEVIQNINQRLAYKLDADLGCWNPNRVLRPPGSVHHESGNVVKVLKEDLEPVPITAFVSLPDVPFKFIDESDLGRIPMPIEVIGKYSWEGKDLEFFLEPKLPTAPGKPEGKGYRSSALTKLAHLCVERGMNNAETLSILMNANGRWGKFKGKDNTKKRLVGIINHVRSQPQHAIDPVAVEADLKLKVYTFGEFANTKVEPDWIIPDLLHSKGVLCLTGPPDVGKSTVTLRFAERIVKGEKFLKWTPKRPAKILLVSMEMPHEELAYFTTNMRLDPNNELLAENLLIMPLGHSLQLRSKEAQGDLNRVLDKWQPEGVLFDSLGVGIGGDISSDQVVLEVFEYTKETLANQYGIFSWFIHHNRKPQPGNRKPNKLEDMYGSAYIGAGATTVMGLWGKKGSDTIEVDCLKLRMAPHFKPFKIKRTPSMDFEIIEGLSEDRDSGIYLPRGFPSIDDDEGPEDETYFGDLGDTI